jgi:hypothetical protein
MSGIEIIRNYEAAIQKIGGTTVNIRGPATDARQCGDSLAALIA